MSFFVLLDAVVAWLGLTLLHATVLVLVAALLSATFLKRKAPALLAAMWTVVAIKFLVPPILPGDFGLSGLLGSVSADWTGSEAGALTEPTLGPLAASQAVGDALATPWMPLLLRIAALVYLTLLVGLVIRSILSIDRMRRTTRRLPAADRELTERVRALTSKLGLHHRLSVVTTEETTTPYLFGLWRPTLVLPARVLTRLDEPGLNALILHELAHVRRGDLWIRWILNAARIAFFFWPPVWWVCRRIERLTEMACDQWVVASGCVSRKTYARSLLDVVKALGAADRPPAAHALAFGRRGLELEERFKMILRTRTLSAKPTWFGLIFLLGWAAFAWAGGAVAQEPTSGQSARGKLVRHAENARLYAIAEQMLTKEQIVKILRRADADGDGQLSLKERRDFEIELGEAQKDAVLSQHPESDLNGDGALDDVELRAFLEKRHAARARLSKVPADVDVNGDGILSDAEMREFELRQKEMALDRMLEAHPDADLDGDGRLNDAEVEELMAAQEATRRHRILELHPEADVDGDGEISAAEFEQQLVAIEQRQRTKIIELHPDADLDGDGEVSRAEFERQLESAKQRERAAILERHPEADVDRDGEVSFKELEHYLRRKENQLIEVRGIGNGAAVSGVAEGVPAGVPAGTPGGVAAGTLGGVAAGGEGGVAAGVQSAPGTKVRILRQDGTQAPQGKVLLLKEVPVYKLTTLEGRKALLKKYPEADANGDGAIDDQEAKALAVKLQKAQKPPKKDN